jgi:RNA polymerase sigma-70 factor (ECF subfamily)
MMPPSTALAERAERFRGLYDATYADIVAYCRRRVDPDTVGDAVGEVYLTAWRRFDDLPTGTSGRLWLFGVARHVIANLTRSAARRERLHLRLVSDPTAVAVADPGSDEAASRVLEAFATLGDDDQEVLRLVTWEALSHAEAGEILGCSANAVGIRVHRARARLAAALATDRFEADPPPTDPTPTDPTPTDPTPTDPTPTDPTATRTDP